MNRSRGVPPLLPLLFALVLLAGCSPAEQSTRELDPEDVNPYYQPDLLMGEEVTLIGEVADYLEDGGFRLSGDVLGGDGVPVVSTSDIPLTEGQLVQVTGTVEEFDPEAFAGDVVSAYENEPVVVVADEVQPLQAVTPDSVEGLVLERLQALGDFSALLQAAGAAGLERTLGAEGPITVFAPTDEAFNRLGTGELQQLLSNPDRLGDVMRYHIVEGELDTDEIASRDTLTTLSGETLDVTTDQEGVEGVYVNGVSIGEPVVDAANGLVYTIPQVLMP